MKVHELIKFLSGFRQDAEVLIVSDESGEEYRLADGWFWTKDDGTVVIG